MTIPYTFANAATPIPLAQLDANFAYCTSAVATYQIATSGQTVFTGINYIVGNNSLQIYVNGSKQVNILNYAETNITTITFVSGLNVGDVVEFVVI